MKGPVVLRRKFNYLIYTYLNYAVRLKLILYLVNGDYGMKKIDFEELKFLNNFNKDIQVVLTKVDKVDHYNNINFITEAANFVKPLKNVRPEIFVTSAKKNYGIDNLRTNIFYDFYSPITPAKKPADTSSKTDDKLILL